MLAKKRDHCLYLIGLCILLLVVVNQPTRGIEAQSNEDDIGEIEWSHDERLIALGTREGQIRIIDLTSQQAIQSFTAYSSAVAEIAWGPNKHHIVTGGLYDATVKIWDINLGVVQNTIPIPTGNRIYAIAWKPDGNAILITQERGNPNLTVWDSSTGEMIYGATSGTGSDIAWNNDQNLFAISYFLPYIEIRDAQTFELVSFVGLALETIPRDINNATLYVDWSPDGTYLISGAVAGEVTVWDVETGEAVYELSAPLTTDQDAQQLYAREVWFSPDRLTFSSVAVDGTYRTWETATGRQLQMTQLDDEIRVAAISPSRTKLAYIGPSNNLILKNIPDANAGPDQTLWTASGMALVTLDATASTDPDGSIVSYDWQLDGATIATDPNPQVELPVGEHTITLLVTDNDGLVDTDEVVIDVREVTPDILRARVEECVTNRGIQRSLNAKVDAQQWSAFIHEVEALRGTQIDEDCAGELIAMAQALRAPTLAHAALYAQIEACVGNQGLCR